MMKKEIGIISATILLAMLSLLAMPVSAIPNVTGPYFTTNYTIGGNAYAIGGTSITINVTVGNITNATANNYNVSAKIFNNTHLMATVYLTNTTGDGNNGTNNKWGGTYTVPSQTFTSAGNITINATNSDQGTWAENVTEKVTWRVYNNDVPRVTSVIFTTNYTVSSNNYAKGGSTITINASIDYVFNTSTNGYNVSAKVYNRTALVATVYLNNSSTNIDTTSQWWTKTYTVPSYDITASGANITINATYFNTTGTLLSNTSQKVNWYIDNTNPATETPACGKTIATATGTCTSTIRMLGGNTYQICWNVTDNVAVDVSNGTIQVYNDTYGNGTLSSAWTGSGVLQSGGSATENKFCYGLNYSSLGSYIFYVAADDNTTHTYRDTTNYTIKFGLPEEDIFPQPTQPQQPIVIPPPQQPLIQLPTMPRLPSFDILTSIMNMIVNGFRAILGLFGIR